MKNLSPDCSGAKRSKPKVLNETAESGLTKKNFHSGRKKKLWQEKKTLLQVNKNFKNLNFNLKVKFLKKIVKGKQNGD